MRNVREPGPAGTVLEAAGPVGRDRQHTTVRRTPRHADGFLVAAVFPAAAGAVPRLRRLVRAVVHRHGLPAGVEEALTVIVSELATNVVLHSGSPDLEVMFEADAASLTVGVRDSGRWRQRPAPRCEPVDMDAPFGRGLALVDAYAVETSVLRSAHGTLVRAVIAL